MYQDRRENKMSVKAFVAKYYEMGERKIITNIWNRTNGLLPPGKYVFVDEKDVLTLNEEVRKGNKVIINEGIKPDDQITINDVEIEVISDFEKRKSNVMNEVNSDLTDLPVLMSNLDILEFVFTFCRFAEKGIFIWDDEVEEKYLEILNTGEEKLIDDLERYLELKDRVKLVLSKLRHIQKVVDDLKDCDNEKDLVKIFRAYKGRPDR